MMNFDLQLFGGLFGGGGGGTTTVEKPVYQSSAPSSVSSAGSEESATATERQETRQKLAKARGRRSTNTGAGTNGALSSTTVSNAAAGIAKRLLGE